ncbi:hypothetical protein ACFUGD_07330 [Streptomyces sp. NPDC057217]|uniref:hypothetical protein n=1 Tax=unclassified Streptomyces TaxID=2593676 RepID=UPI00362E0B1E
MHDWLRRIPAPLLWGALWLAMTTFWWIGGQFTEEPRSLILCAVWGGVQTGVPMAVLKLGEYFRSFTVGADSIRSEESSPVPYPADEKQD